MAENVLAWAKGPAKSNVKPRRIQHRIEEEECENRA